MQRRDFVLGCAVAAAADGVAFTRSARAEEAPRSWSRALLVDEADRPLKAADLPQRRTLLFHYPFVGTPAFLIDLGRATRRDVALATSEQQRYTWRGGVGPRESIVSFSAICAHRMAYPTKAISFISYRDERSPVSQRGQVIHCCSEHSQYDPADGARVVAGPAKQPLATIVLEHDPGSDALYAVATLGGELFDDFFESFPMQLALEFEGRERTPVGERARVVPIERYCRQLMRCG